MIFFSISAHLPTYMLLKLQREVKSSKYSPQSKKKNPQRAEQGHAQMQQCA
jgi:hypothetical protein